MVLALMQSRIKVNATLLNFKPYTSLMCHYFKGEHRILPLVLGCLLEAVNGIDVWAADVWLKISTDLPVLSMYLEAFLENLENLYLIHRVVFLVKEQFQLIV